MRPFEYVKARDLAEAGALLLEKKGRAHLLAGGTDLLTQFREHLVEVERVVDLQEIPSLDRIESNSDRLALGALVPLARVGADPRIRERWTALAQGALAAATPQIRNAGTLGGNLCQRPRCWYYRNEFFRCRKKGGDDCFALEGENKYHAIFGGDTCRMVHPSDTAPPLMALEATVTVVSSQGERMLGLSDFFIAPEIDVTRECILEPGELISEIRVPVPPEGSQSAYLKVREKASFDFALVSCAAVITLDAGICRRARLVLGGVAPHPWRCREAEQALLHKPLTDQVIGWAAEAAVMGAAPLSKNRYKVRMGMGVVRRILNQIREAGD